MKERRARHGVGFTLVEVVAGLAIAVFLLGALYQAIVAQDKYNEIATREMAEPQIARTLLHQIADELRSITPPVAATPEPARARMLLGLGDVPIESAPGAAPSEPGTNFTDPPPIDGAERFGLLGTSNRLLFLFHQSFPAEKRPLGDAALLAEQSGSQGEDKRRERERWGDARQVFYLLRPLPEVLEKRKGGNVDAEEPTIEEGEELEEKIEPMYGGLIRQEVSLPFATWAHNDAFFHLRDHLFAKEENEEFRPPEMEIRESGITVDPEQVPIPDRLKTQVVSDRITAILFRYHDGTSWQPNWPHAERLPRAVEISLSFDPRAADPERLREYLEARPSESTESTAVNAASVNATEDDEAEPMFPYRLVVALSTSGSTRAPVAETSEASPMREDSP